MTDRQLRNRMRTELEAEIEARARSRSKTEPALAPAATEDAASPRQRLNTLVHEIAARAMRMPMADIDPTENLANYGIDSIAITEVMVQISRRFGIAVAPTTFFEARNLIDLAGLLEQRYGKAVVAVLAAETPTAPKAEAVPDIDSWLRRHGAVRRKKASQEKPALAPRTMDRAAMPIAIIGMQGAFPKSPDIEALRQHLLNGDDCIEVVPEDRWNWRDVYGDPRKGPYTDVKYGGFVPGADTFDAAFFGISPREAELIDPQHRLFMECVWGLLENAGHAPSRLAGRKVGLFLGINLLDYVEMANRAGLREAQQLTGLGHAFCPNRLSFLLDIHGPSEVIDTACSSSLVAIHRAVMSIRHEGCKMAIAGGSNLMLSPMQHIMFSRVGMICADGRCKTFSAAANGYARADGVGAVLLKPLADAERDNDRILGVILASAEHHGGGASSLTAPNPQAQSRLIAEAHREARIDPRSIGMIECHGTGTKLGDPIEIEGLKMAFDALYRDRGLAPPAAPHIGLGSIKSNIGHAETTAGVAGLIKTLLAFEEGIRFRTLHCEEPNPLIDLGGSPFMLLDRGAAWPRPIIDGREEPRRAGISSFGAGGTNVHIVVEEYRGSRPLPAAAATTHVIPFSARSAAALDSLLRSMLPHVARHALRDLAGTLQFGRNAFAHRVAFLARDALELSTQIERYLSGERSGIAHGIAPRGAVAKRIDEPGSHGPEALAGLWAAGAEVAWEAMAGAQPFRRVALPSYPFERRRYWLPLPAPAAPPAPERLRQAGEGTFRVTLRATDSFLRDHIVNGVPVLPGVMYLELAREAAIRSGLAPAALRNVTWLQPLQVREEAEVTIRLTATAAQSFRIEITSGGGILHAQMTASPAQQGTALHDLAALQARHTEALDVEAIYRRHAERGIAFGPAQRSLTSLSLARDGDAVTSVLARIVIPPCVAGSLTAHGLHPSILDGALQAAIGMAPEGDEGTALPFALTALTGIGPLHEEMHVFIRPSAEAGKLDLDLLDGEGQAAYALTGFATRPLLAAAGRNAVLAFTPTWKALDPGFAGNTETARIVIAGRGIDVTGDARSVIHRLPDGSLPVRALALAKAISQQPVGTPALAQLLLTDADVASALHALLQTAALETPGLRAQTIILGPEASSDAEVMALAAQPAGLYRLIAGGIERLGYQEATLPPARFAWRDRGVYLITGGGGALGQAVAHWLRRNAPGATIIAMGRTRPVDADDTFITADAANRDAVTGVVARIRAECGALHGVFHCAGLLRDGPLRGKAEADLAAVLAPKLAGARNLDDAIGTEPLDAFVLFSSLSGVFGNPGQADYAMANAALDHFAEARARRVAAGACHGATVSIAWPLWQDGGMRMTPEAVRLMGQTTGLAPLPLAEGLDLLERAMAASFPRVAVAYGEGAKIRARFAMDPPPRPAATPARRNTAGLRNRLAEELLACAAGQLKVSAEDLAPNVELTEYGFDSIGFTQFANALNDRFGLEIGPTLFFECQTIDLLAEKLADTHGGMLAGQLGLFTEALAEVPAPVAEARPAESSAARTPLAEAPVDDPVAIISMTGIFPGAPDIETFWRNLSGGVDSISEIPPDRWDWRAIWGNPQKENGRTNVKWGGFIDGVDAFDAAFFGLSAPEARGTDPQQRLLLTESWKLFERAGIAPQSLSGRKVGVFIGIADTGYGRLLAGSEATQAYMMTGLAPSLGPNRISHFYNFHGPSIAVETACSSALVAVHRAAESIRTGECECAIAGGVNTLLLPDTYIGFSRAGMLAPDGRSKPFSADANGYARGEGIGLFLLKPLSAALRDGDEIHGVIRASAENHGGRASSLTAPNPRAQAELLRTAYRKANIDPRSVSYIEAHGTGTPLGDPIEFEALSAAFTTLADEAQTKWGSAPTLHCAIGSVKSNIGHLEIAAGAAGLMKVLLQLKHRRIAATLHAARLNPLLKLAGSGFHVAASARDWTPPKAADGSPLPLRAGVSSFGFGGANSHLVIEGHERAVPRTDGDAPQMILVSARNEEQLRESARMLAETLASGTCSLADVAFTLATGRDAMEHRIAFVATSTALAAARLAAFAGGETPPGIHKGETRAARALVGALESDGAIAAAIEGLAGRGGQDALLRLWVMGVSVDWSRVMPRRRRAALPTYPFQRDRFWPSVAASPAATPPATPTVTAPARQPPAPPRPQETQEASLRRRLIALAAAALEIQPSMIDVDAELGDYGFDSVSMTSFAARVNADLDLELNPPDFFTYPTIAKLAGHILAAKPGIRTASEPPVAEAPLHEQPGAVEDGADPIVIAGMSCEFPGARGPEAFWTALREGRDCITRIPEDRWDWRAIDGDPRKDPGKTDIHWGGFIEGLYEFDPLFFNIAPREALYMDPQHRLMLLHAWKAIEDAGESPRALAGARGGVFVGTAASGYRDVIGADTGTEGFVATGSVASVGPNRISYFLDWHGPSEPVETACSSSLVALHRACQAIMNGECDFALVGGVNSIVTPEAHVNFAKAGMLAPDGRCKTFSAEANGYVRGEGVGMIFLKRLSAARRDGNPVLAIVRSTAVNHGGKANSLTAPNGAAQAELLAAAWQKAGIDPRTITYIEAHGTGTALGDPVEINAIKSAWSGSAGQDQDITPRCAIGAVKTNIGHLELAAGIAGIIKTVLQMKAETLAPSLHGGTLNPYIALAGTPFRFLPRAEPWERLLTREGKPIARRAGISSFGYGGVNSHAVLEEYVPQDGAGAQARGALPVVLSAHDSEALRAQALSLRTWISAHPLAAEGFAEFAFTLQTGRAAMRHRLAFTAESSAEVVERLSDYLEGRSERIATGVAPPDRDQSPPLRLETAEAAQRWVKGAAIDWPALYLGTPRRMRLPTYPFARQVYRIGSKASAPDSILPHAKTLRLTPDIDGLSDHRFKGACVVPGAYTLALAASHCGLALPLRIEGTLWSRALVVPGHGLELVITSTPIATGIGIRIATDGQEAMRATARRDETPPQAIDLQRLRQDCAEAVRPEDIYSAFERIGLSYGPRYRALTGLWRGQGQVLAQLDLPTAPRRVGPLVPELLDAAFQSALALFPSNTGESALPFALASLALHQPMPDRLMAHLRLKTASTTQVEIDITLCAGDGRIIATAEGFTARRTPAPSGAGPSGGGDARQRATRMLVEMVARETGVPTASIERALPLEHYGIDSLLIARLTAALERHTGPLPATLFFDHRSIDDLAEWLASRHASSLQEASGSPPAQMQPAAAAAAAHPPAPDAIAIVGVAGRYPGAGDIEQFWESLAAGRDAVTTIPPDRWDHARYYDPRPGTPGRTNSRWGGFIEGHDCFDPLFFNIAPGEAEYMDPQERLFLQCAWQALEDSGHTRANLAPLEGALAGGNVGVFVGVMYEEYQLYGAERSLTGQPMALGGSAATIANRVSYFCDFHGPSMTVDTMCSSSLTAIHLACEAIRSGSCEAAIAGGVNLTLHPNKYIGLAQSRFLSSSGRCAAFGQGGDGYVPGEAVGAVVLKPLSLALRDGNTIHAVIRGSALNHGGKTNGYTVPNPAAQSAVISNAFRRAGVSPAEVSYVEAHGTGTSLGDPIEIAALARAFGEETQRAAPCAIGSVKANIGHCESAAGIAGLTKVLLQMRHRALVPSLHSDPPNPALRLAETPFVVQTELAPWEPASGRRLASLSSFGAGGSNAHLLLEDVDEAVPALPPAPMAFPLSARTPQRLDALLRSMARTFATMPESLVPHAAFTLQEGRESFEERVVLLAASKSELLAALDTAIGGGRDARVLRGHVRTPVIRARQRFPSWEGAARAWTEGQSVDWSALRTGTGYRRISLPAYPFAQERFWVPGAEKPAQAVSEARVRMPLLFAPHWQETPLEPAAAPAHALTLLCDWRYEPREIIAALGGQAEWLKTDGPVEARYTSHAQRLFAIIQQLVRSGEENTLLQLVVPLQGEGALMEGLSGLLRTARLEHPALQTQVIGISPDTPEIAALLLRERGSTGQDVRHADGKRLTRVWREIEAAEPPAHAWRDGGTYLIVGGAGAIGLSLCEDIAAHAPGATIWIAHRSPLSAAVKQRFAGLRAEIHTRQTNLTEEASVRALADEITRTHGRLDALIHAAGTTRDRLLIRKTAEEVETVFQPKVLGWETLRKAFAGREPALVILFASAAGALGNPGQADYAAANAWLDAVAATYAGTRTIAIDWPYWREGGMQMPEAAVTAMRRAAGAEPLETPAALKALHAIIRSSERQVLVLDGDHQRLRGIMRPERPRAEAKHVAAVPAADLAWLTGEVADALKIPSNEIDPEAPLDRYGVDSIQSLRIIERLQARLGPLPPALLLENPSISLLAKALNATSPPPPLPVLKSGSPGDAVTREAEDGASWSVPLTANQQGLYAQQTLDPKLFAYNVPIAFTCAKLDPGLAEAAWQAMLARHPILAARVAEVDGALCLVTNMEPPALRRSSVSQTALEQARRRAREPFDLGRGGVCRAELIEAPGEDAILLLTAHHIAVDGLSAVLIADDFWSCYARLARRETLPPRTGRDFRSSAEAEARYLASLAAREDERWWQETLAGAQRIVPVPLDGNGAHRPAFALRHVSGDERAAWQQAARSHGTTMAAFCAAAMIAMLHGQTGEGDITMAMPTIGRGGADSFGMVGFCVNMVHLRSSVAPAMTGSDLLRQVRERLAAAVEHGRLPFATIAQRNEPLHDVTFAYQNFGSVADFASLPEGVRHVAELRQTADTLLAFEVHETGRQLEFILAHDAGQVSEATAGLLLDRLIACATKIASTPDQPLASILALDGEDAALVRRWSVGEALAPETTDVFARILEQLKQDPDAVAIVSASKTLTRKQLLSKMNGVAKALQDKGLAAGDKVAVLLGQEPQSIAALLACLALGCTWMPLSPEEPDGRLSRIIDDARPKLLLTHPRHLERAAQIARDCPVLGLDDSVSARGTTALRDPGRGHGETAYIIYTSGTSGSPKGVAISRGALNHHCAAAAHFYGITPQDRVLQFAAPHVDPFLEQTLPALACGARIVMRGEAMPEPAALKEMVEREAITIADLPPAYLREVLLSLRDQAITAASPTLRLLIIGGEAPAADLAQLWSTGPFRAAQLINAYGPTEATVTCIAHRATGDERPLPIGRPLPGTEIRIVGRNLRQLPAAACGELLIGGARLAEGYTGSAELTAERFILLAEDENGEPRRFYRTGDLASFAADGSGAVLFHGRVDSLVKIRGHRVDLGEVLAALRSAGLRDAAVHHRAGDLAAPLVAYCVEDEGAFDVQVLRELMLRALPVHMVPTHFVRVDRIPLNATGKIDWAALPPPAPGPALPDDTKLTPEEESLRLIWSELLGISAGAIGRNSDFFALGGHSLLVLRLQSRIAARWGLNLPSTAFLMAATLSAQAALIRRPATATAERSPLVPMRQGSGAPILLVHPVGGGLACYARLLDHLPPGRPVYGFLAPGVETGSPWAGDLPGLAQAYIEAARAVVGGDDWLLAGWSMGGVIAQEMVRQLEETGGRIGLLALIDAYPGQALGPAETEGGELRDFLTDVSGGDAHHLPPADELQRLLEAGQLPEDLAPDVPAADLAQRFRTYRTHRRILAEHRARAIRTPLTLLAAKAGAQLCVSSWCGLAPLASAPLILEADHFSLLKPPVCRDVGAALTQAVLKSQMAMQ